MKMTRSTRPLATLALMFSVLALANPGFAQEPVSPCKQECMNKHQGNVEALMQERPVPGAVGPSAHRETVLKAIDALNNCVKACDLAPTPDPEPAPRRYNRG